LADLEEAENGQFKMEIEGRNIVVDVSVFESFGESAFRLTF
jgi:hypothetical protein